MDIKIQKLGAAPPLPSPFMQVADAARDQLAKGEALVVTIPEGKQPGPFLRGVQDALNDSRYDERFDAWFDARGEKVIVRRAR